MISIISGFGVVLFLALTLARIAFPTLMGWAIKMPPDSCSDPENLPAPVEAVHEIKRLAVTEKDEPRSSYKNEIELTAAYLTIADEQYRSHVKNRIFADIEEIYRISTQAEMNLKTDRIISPKVSNNLLTAEFENEITFHSSEDNQSFAPQKIVSLEQFKNRKAASA
jgi:hypothetical protein